MRFIYIIMIFLSWHHLEAQEERILWTAAWSPDDTYLAAGGDHGVLYLLNGKTFDLIKSYPVDNVILSRLKWHPSENKLAVITQSDSFKAKILDLDKNEWIELEGLESSLRALDWNHDGSLLAVSEFDGEISIFNTKGERVSRFLADPKSVLGLDWHPSKNILTSVGSQIGIFNIQGEPLKRNSPREEEVVLLCVEWHPSGAFFATGDYGFAKSSEDKRIQYWNDQGDLLAESESAQVEYRNIRWNPNGKQLASANDALRIWDTTGKLILETEATDDYLWGVDWNSDGSRIVTSSSQGVISVWDKNLTMITSIIPDF